MIQAVQVMSDTFQPKQKANGTRSDKRPWNKSMNVTEKTASKCNNFVGYSGGDSERFRNAEIRKGDRTPRRLERFITFSRGWLQPINLSALSHENYQPE